MSVQRMIPARNTLGRATAFKTSQKWRYLLCATFGPCGPCTERGMDHLSVALVFRRFSRTLRVHQVCPYPFAESDADFAPSR